MSPASCRQAAQAPCRQIPAVRHSLATFEGMRKMIPSTASSTSALSCRRTTVSRRSAVITEAKAGARKVALLGAAGGIGQPLALLLKMQPYVAELALYDIANTVGVAADLSHCNTSVQVWRSGNNLVPHHQYEWDSKEDLAFRDGTEHSDLSLGPDGEVSSHPHHA